MGYPYQYSQCTLLAIYAETSGTPKQSKSHDNEFALFTLINVKEKLENILFSSHFFCFASFYSKANSVLFLQNLSLRTLH